MHKLEQDKQGIVPAIMRLRGLFEELAEAITSQREGKLTAERLQEMENKIAMYSDEVRMLPETINHSYELIQMVIQSIHSSRSELKKSVDGLIKKTGMQLQKVTSTTEEATNKILDVAEKLDEDQMKIIALIEDLEANSCSGDDLSAKFEEVKSKVYQNQESAFLIMDYLQFQDITAQQIAGAYSLLADTEKTLLYVSDLLKRFDTNREKFEGAISDIDKRSFNEDATFNNKRVLQEAIDDLFSSGDVNADIPEDKQPEPEDAKVQEKPAGGSSQDEIDALFGGGAKKSDTAASQDDIDALFDDKKADKTSQDEIDKLFS